MGCGSCGSSGCSGCHSCSSCGSSSCNWGCGCGCAVPAGCNPSICQTSYPNCGTVPPANPNPYYIQSAQCQENHCEQIINNYYSPQVCVSYGFNIPGCGLTAVIYFSDVPKLLVGAYLWHPTYGYFKVIAFNSQTGQTTILNTCEDGNAAPGTAIPACTCFIVTPEPIDIAVLTGVCVAVDFTAPAVYDCILITVTSINGLVVGGYVGIGSGVYLVSEVNSATTITICNEGQGITPGTPVIALDAAGGYQYCLSILGGANPCDAPSITSGQPVICGGSGLQPLEGGVIGDVLTLSGTSPNVALFQSPCGNVAAASGPVIICNNGMRPLSGTGNGQVLTLVNSGTEAGAYTNPFLVGGDQDEDLQSGVLFSPGTGNQNVVATAAASLTNTSPYKNMVVLVEFTWYFRWHLAGGASPASDAFSFTALLEYDNNTGGFVTFGGLLPFQQNGMGPPTAGFITLDQAFSMTTRRLISLAPAAAGVCQSRLTLTGVGPPSGGFLSTLTAESVYTEVSMYGVAV